MFLFLLPRTVQSIVCALMTIFIFSRFSKAIEHNSAKESKQKPIMKQVRRKNVNAPNVARHAEKNKKKIILF